MSHQTTDYSNEAVIKFFQDSGITWISYVCITLEGNLHQMSETIESLPGILNGGLGVDGSSLGFTPTHESDVLLKPINESRCIVSYGPELETGFILCKVVKCNGEPCGTDPLTILDEQVKRCRQLGYESTMFSELEFFLLDPETGRPVDNSGYMDIPPADTTMLYRRRLAKRCIDANINVKRLHAEVAEAQAECEFNLMPSLKNANDTSLAMLLSRILAKEMGYIIDYDPKPLNDVNGSGLHMHVQLRDLTTNENAMSDEDSKYNLGEVGRYFMGGLCKYAREICAVFGRSDSTFKRLEPGYEAPTDISWGAMNRTCLIRLPLTSPDKVRVEFRGGDASGSPHLLACAILAAGLSGVENKIAPPKEAEAVGSLPVSVAECKTILETSDWLEDIFGREALDWLANPPKQH
ncbi:hypothetical protein PCE1_000577 [Barthelona sp. PCE]